MTGGAGRHLFWRRYAPFLVQVCPFLAQVRPILGAGTPHSWRRCAHSWRRYAPFLAQVGFWVGDLLHRRAQNHDSRRRSPPFFLTCAKTPLHLRQQSTSPATRIMYKRDLYNGMVLRRRFLVQVFQGRCPKGRLTRYLNTKQPSEMH